MQREVRFEAGYDYREEDKDKPRGKHRGQHGLQIRFLLRGDEVAEGIVQFLVYTDWLPTWVVSQGPPWKEKMVQPTSIPSIRDMFPMAADLGHHWPVPTYEGESSMNCDLLEGGTCYYDGSGLNAEPVLAALLTEGDAGVWKILEDYYQSLVTG